jgi:sugar lactone lactonase YvrE
VGDRREGRLADDTPWLGRRRRHPRPAAAEPVHDRRRAVGSLVVGQQPAGSLVRLTGSRATTIADGPPVFHVSVAGGKIYAAAQDGVYRIDGSTFTRVSPTVDATAVAVDTAGNLYVAVYVGWIKKVTPDGTVTTIAGDGTEGYSGDGGPATAATLFHPHAIAIGRDGVLYVADTENRHIRRIDLSTGVITTFGGDVGITVALAVGPDGQHLLRRHRARRRGRRRHADHAGGRDHARRVFAARQRRRGHGRRHRVRERVGGKADPAPERGHGEAGAGRSRIIDKWALTSPSRVGRSSRSSGWPPATGSPWQTRSCRARASASTSTDSSPSWACCSR